MHISTASITNDTQQVILSPIHDLAGALSEYKNTADISFEEIRKQSWEDNTKHIKSDK